MDKLPSGKYRQRVTWTDSSGKRHYKSFTANTKREAQRLATMFMAKKQWKDHSLTVGEAVDRLIEINRNIYSPSTIRAYLKAKKNWMKDIANCDMDYITDEILQEWVNNLAQNYSPKTVLCAYGVFSACKSQFTPEKNYNVRLPKQKRHEICVPQRDEIEKIIESAQNTPLYICILLGAQCGMRRGEMSALTWDDIDLEHKKIRVNKTLVQGEDDIWVVKAPKSYAGNRYLDMSEAIYQYFLSANKKEPPCPLQPNAITRGFKRICTKLDMNYHEHLLRHYFCSVCCNLGIAEAVTAKLMGHADTTMVHQVYGHVLNEFEQSARNTITDYFNK